ncbi:hypothetical protein RYZ26_19415 [Terasakiella sp. A23]|uniref:hypothetical protein n=1 Tax=Terasakiella sp. FCG-A23 TaxID=3080561 RepID=UPI002955AB48|nr:hypothetical protein [Terasakiella sp. A23]MDV7341779.1 hypothetical protein [Terasakiella sp. A23]
MTHLSELKLYERLAVAKQHLQPVQSDYRIVFEADIDHPASVLIPDPNWMACALNGDILPPVSVYHDLEYDEDGRVLNGHILHDTPPIGAMTEEEAIEYLIQKDIPAHVWNVKNGNSIKMIVCRKDQLPQTRNWRNAWKIQQEKSQ